MKGERPRVLRDGRYCPGDTAAMFGVSRRTLDRWVLAGRIRRRYTVEGRPVFLGKDITEAWERRYRLQTF